VVVSILETTTQYDAIEAKELDKEVVCAFFAHTTQFSHTTLKETPYERINISLALMLCGIIMSQRGE